MAPAIPYLRSELKNIWTNDCGSIYWWKEDFVASSPLGLLSETACIDHTLSGELVPRSLPKHKLGLLHQDSDP